MNNPAQYLSFLNSLGFPVQQQKIIEVKSHSIPNLSGWQGLKSLVCLAETGEIYDIDFRYAWGLEIWQQNLVDHGWCESNLLARKPENGTKRHKLIIYLCEPTTKLNQKQKIAIISQHFIIGNYWNTVAHLYQLLPIESPFELKNIQRSQDTKSNNHSNFLTTEQPIATPETGDRIPSTFFLPPDSKRIGEGGLRTKGLYRKSLNQLPLVSVITVVFNGEKYLEQTIQSIINSSYPNLEYIVIDGASTDSSLKIIKKYEDYIDYWVSEPDKGIYDAMNKGTIVSSGSHTLHINADDLIYDFQALEKRIKESLAKKKDLYSLNLLSSIFFYRLEAGELVKKTPIQPHKDRNMNILKVPVGHQGFIGLKNSISIFDTSYQITAARGVIANKASQEKIDLSLTPIAICRSGGASYGFNQKKSAEIKRAISNSKSILVYASLLLSNMNTTILKLAQITGLTKIKKRILR